MSKNDEKHAKDDDLKHDRKVKSDQDQQAVAEGDAKAGRNIAPSQGPPTSMGASGPEPSGDPAPRVKLALFQGLSTQLQDLIERADVLREKVDNAGLAGQLDTAIGAAQQLLTSVKQVFASRGVPLPEQPEGEATTEAPKEGTQTTG